MENVCQAPYLTDTEDIKRGSVNSTQQEFFRPQLFQNGGLSRSGQVGHREVPGIG
jgi:hypothetical protein